MAATPSDRTDQKREFARVDDHLPLSWRRVDEKERAEIIAHYKKFRCFPERRKDVNSLLRSLDISDKLKKFERTDPTLAHILGQVDIKLNLILRLFHPDEQERPMLPTWVNLSGGGIAFKEMACDMVVGETLEIRLAFSLETMAAILCYARVVKIFPPEKEGSSKVACQFQPILDPDRETLIQHIVKRQTEEIRARRGR